MVNIFDTLPRNFFNIFNTADRVVISECICVLYELILRMMHPLHL